MIIETRKELDEISYELDGMYDVHADDQRCEGIKEDDENFITNNMEDIYNALTLCNKVLEEKTTVYPKNIPFCSEEVTFVEYAIESIEENNNRK
jgi:hypothetical protein